MITKKTRTIVIVVVVEATPFRKYFRSACIINGSVPFGGEQIANVAAATAILPPPPPSVKKIVHMQQQNHEKQMSKKILQLETRAKAKPTTIDNDGAKSRSRTVRNQIRRTK